MFCLFSKCHTYLQYVFILLVILCSFNGNLGDESKESNETKAIRYESLTCTKLRDLSDHIMERLRETTNKSYEGGNPEWINNNLPSYDVSELRFMDVFDGSCDRIPNPTNCHQLYQEHEKDMYDWFLNHKNSTKSIYEDLFVDKLKLCCRKNQYGPNCEPCKIISADGTVCDGKGECKGEYTRAGDGTCECQSSYVGESCESCAPNHFKETNGQCQSCHIACSEGCTAFSESACLGDKCGQGYERAGESGCKKIDFCANHTATNCAKDEYCVNLDTKFECRKCDKSCNGCTGPSNKDCYSCGMGYTVGNRSCDKIHSKRSKYRFVKYEEEEKTGSKDTMEAPANKGKIGEEDKKSSKENKAEKKDRYVSKRDKKEKKKGKDYKKNGEKKKKHSKSKKDHKKHKEASPNDVLYEKLHVKPQSDDVFDEL